MDRHPDDARGSGLADVRGAATRDADGCDGAGCGCPAGSIEEDGACLPCGAPTVAGLELYLSFDEGPPGSARDASGHDRHGTPFALARVEGKLGAGVAFDGVSSLVALGGDLTLDGSRTICAWVRADDTRGLGLPVVVAEADRPGPGDAVEVFGVAAADPEGEGCADDARVAYVDADGCVASSRATAQAGWSHVCWVWSKSGRRMTLHVDGEATSGSKLSLRDATLDAMWVGASPSWWDGATRARFAGALDEVALWSRALTTQEVALLYRGGEGCRLR